MNKYQFNIFHTSDLFGTDFNLIYKRDNTDLNKSVKLLCLDDSTGNTTDIFKFSILIILLLQLLFFLIDSQKFLLLRYIRIK